MRSIGGSLNGPADKADKAEKEESRDGDYILFLSIDKRTKDKGRKGRCSRTYYYFARQREVLQK
jgi:hypothetical protein